MSSNWQQALALFKSGDYKEVIKFCERNKGSHPGFMMLLPVAYGKVNNTSKATRLFERLQKEQPTNPDVFHNHGLMFLEVGQPHKARPLLQQTVQLNRSYHQGWHSLGNCYLDLGEHASAITAFERAYSLAPSNPEYLRSCANTLFITGDYAKAMLAIQALLNSPVESSSDVVFALNCIYKLKASNEHNAFIDYALSKYSEIDDVLFFDGLLSIDQKKFIRARTQLALLESRMPVPKSFGVVANLAFARFMVSPSEAHLDEIERFLEDSPELQNVVFVVDLFESLGMTDRALQILDNPKFQFVGNHNLQILRARVLLRKGKASEAKAELLSISTSNVDIEEDVAFELIRIQEGVGGISDAARAIRTATILNNKRVGNEPAAKFLNEIESIDDALRKLSNDNASRAKNTAKFVFIVGFPRTGTTLLESRLAGIEQVKILEETHALSDLYRTLQRRSGDIEPFAYLNSLDETELSIIADEYIDSLGEYADISNASFIVDKMPMNGLYLQLIQKLFPSAAVILMRRDPRDVCLSCLKQKMIQINDVETFKRCYQAFFSVIDKYQNTLSLPVLQVQYEALVSDYQNEFAKILDYIGVEVGTLSMSHSQTNRFYNTPSNQQVSKPIYTSSVNLFEKYAEEIDFSALDNM